MPNPKKTTPGQGPPDELAVPKAAADAPGPQFQDDFQSNAATAIHGPYPSYDSLGQQNAPPVRVAGPDEAEWPPVRVEPTGVARVSLQRSTANPTNDQALWLAIRNKTSLMGFSFYERFIDRVLCKQQGVVPPHIKNQRDNSQLGYGVDAYQLLKAATETFLILKVGVLHTSDQLLPTENRFNWLRAQEEGRLGRSLTLDSIKTELSGYIGAGSLPYIDRVLGNLDEPGEPDDEEPVIPGGAASPLAQLMSAVDRPEGPSPFCDSLLDTGPFFPLMIELLWSYWHEEGMLVQAINAISLRFQNKRLPGENNPLANLELSPLRPLSNLLWGYIQDEPFRLTVARRAYEYSHEYGLTLMGRAVPGLRPADHRSKFLEAFHSLLHEVAVFYKEDSDTTVIANGFPLLNSLKEVHMLLAEGAHNQFGDLPWTARVEMLIQQWLLSRRELRDFLRGRPMVPYKEPWMGQVDTLRRMFGWGDTPVTHFRDLATFGEQILLSIRYADWINVDDEDAAKNWARYWKPEIQGYVHAYRAATGIDLTTSDVNKQINSTPPSVLLQRRIGHRVR